MSCGSSEPKLSTIDTTSTFSERDLKRFFEKDWGKARYSLPFFMHPVPHMPLNCLPQTVNEEHPKNYEDITADEFLRQRLIALGLLDD